MQKWLRTKYDKFIHRTKLWIYVWCLELLRKLRIYHTEEIIRKTNSKEGFVWNDRLLLQIQHTQGNIYHVVYCEPGVAFGHVLVDMDDLITGIAHLPVNKRYMTKTVVDEAISNQKLGHWAGGVTRIGELVFPKILDDDSSSYDIMLNPNRHKEAREEIQREFKEKEKDIYR